MSIDMVWPFPSKFSNIYSISPLPPETTRKDRSSASRPLPNLSDSDESREGEMQSNRENRLPDRPRQRNALETTTPAEKHQPAKAM
jgi:hypothetical protein